jgi:hypothetical protein
LASIPATLRIAHTTVKGDRGRGPHFPALGLRQCQA